MPIVGQVPPIPAYQNQLHSPRDPSSSPAAGKPLSPGGSKAAALPTTASLPTPPCNGSLSGSPAGAPDAAGGGLAASEGFVSAPASIKLAPKRLLSGDARLDGLQSAAGGEAADDTQYDFHALADLVNSRGNSFDLPKPGLRSQIQGWGSTHGTDTQEGPVGDMGQGAGSHAKASRATPYASVGEAWLPAGPNACRREPVLAPPRSVPLVYRSMKVLVVGARGLGKTTFVANLMEGLSGGPTAVSMGLPPTPTSEILFKNDPGSLAVRASTLDADGRAFTFVLQDTPGFHPESVEGFAKSIIAHIVHQNELYLEAEEDPYRTAPMTDFPDTRIDACLFLVPDEGMSPGVVSCLRTLCQIVPVIPILAKADLLSPAKRDLARAEVASALATAGCALFRFRPAPIALSGFPFPDHIFATGPGASGPGGEGDVEGGRRALQGELSDAKFLRSLLFTFSFLDLKKNTETRFLAWRQARLLMRAHRTPTLTSHESSTPRATLASYGHAPVPPVPAYGGGWPPAVGAPVGLPAVGPPRTATAPPPARVPTEEIATRNAEFVRAISRQFNMEHMLGHGPKPPAPSAVSAGPPAPVTPEARASGPPADPKSAHVPEEGFGEAVLSHASDAVRKLASGLAFESILAHAQKLTAEDANFALESDPVLARVRDLGRDSAIEAVSAHVRRLMAANEATQEIAGELVWDREQDGSDQAQGQDFQPPRQLPRVLERFTGLEEGIPAFLLGAEDIAWATPMATPRSARTEADASTPTTAEGGKPQSLDRASSRKPPPSPRDPPRRSSTDSEPALTDHASPTGGSLGEAPIARGRLMRTGTFSSESLDALGGVVSPRAGTGPPRQTRSSATLSPAPSSDAMVGVRALARVASIQAITAAVQRAGPGGGGGADGNGSAIEPPGTPGQDTTPPTSPWLPSECAPWQPGGAPLPAKNGAETPARMDAGLLAHPILSDATTGDVQSPSASGSSDSTAATEHDADVDPGTDFSVAQPHADADPALKTRPSAVARIRSLQRRLMVGALSSNKSSAAASPVAGETAGVDGDAGVLADLGGSRLPAVRARVQQLEGIAKHSSRR